MNVLLQCINIYPSQFCWKQTGNLCSNQTDRNTHMLNTQTQTPDVWLLLKNTRLFFFNTWSAKASPTFPPTSNPTNGVSYIPKTDIQYFINISYNQSQLPSRTNRVQVTFHEGWSHSVSEEQQCLCSTVGWEIWDHSTLKLRQCIFSRVIKFKGSTKLFTYKAFQQALGAFSFGAPLHLPWQFCIQTFGKWLQGLDLLCRFGDPISLCTAASCISNLCPTPYAAAIPLLHSKAPKSALEQPRGQHRMSRLSAKEIWQLKWLTSAVSMGRRK